MNDYSDILEQLASRDYRKVKKCCESLVNDSNFLKIIICINDPFIFDRFMKMNEYKIDTSSIYAERKKYIREALDIDVNKKNIILMPDRWIVEYIICYYFEDNYYNFMANFYQMITYLTYTKKELVNKNNIDLYKEFVDLRNMSLMDKIGFFKLLLDNGNIMEMFYDDMNTVRTDSHKELVINSLKLTKDSDVYQKGISNRLGIDVYMLDGEAFFGFVRCFNIDRNDLSDHFAYINSTKERLGYSFSYISDKNIGTTDYNQKSVVLFYNDIDYKNIMYVHHADLHAKKMNEQDDFLSEKENEILTPHSLVAKTNNYNEIYIKSNNNGIKPTALICYDSISANDIAFADKYNLAILVINRKKYKRYETYEDDYDNYTYNI